MINIESMQINALRTISEALIDSGQLTKAYQIATTIKHDRKGAEALVMIVRTHAQMGLFNEAYQTVTMIDWMGQRASALIAIGKAQAQTGQLIDANNSFIEAYQTATTIEMVWEQATLMTEIAAAQAQIGQIEEAYKIATAIKSRSQYIKALQTIANLQLQAGCIDDARQIFIYAFEAAIIIEDYKDQTLKSIATAQARAGFGPDALVTAEAILTEREKHLPAIAEALLDAGDLASFKQLLIPCAAYLEAAYTMCGLLARAYPDQANAIAAVIIEQEQGERA
jgi:tetratricopeptide (TPR) repeat protein